MNIVTYIALIGTFSLMFNAIFDNIMFRVVTVFCLAFIVGITLNDS